MLSVKKNIKGKKFYNHAYEFLTFNILLQIKFGQMWYENSLSFWLERLNTFVSDVMWF